MKTAFDARKYKEVCKGCGCARSMHEIWGCACGECDVRHGDYESFRQQKEAV